MASSPSRKSTPTPPRTTTPTTNCSSRRTTTSSRTQQAHPPRIAQRRVASAARLNVAGKVAEGFDAAIPPELEGERSESEPPAGTPRPGPNRGTSPRLPALKNGQPPKLTPKARSPRDLSRSPRQVTPRGAGNRVVRQASFTPALERLQRGSSTPAIERPKDNSDLRQASFTSAAKSSRVTTGSPPASCSNAGSQGERGSPKPGTGQFRFSDERHFAASATRCW